MEMNESREGGRDGPCETIPLKLEIGYIPTTNGGIRTTNPIPIIQTRVSLHPICFFDPSCVSSCRIIEIFERLSLVLRGIIEDEERIIGIGFIFWIIASGGCREGVGKEGGEGCGVGGKEDGVVGFAAVCVGDKVGYSCGTSSSAVILRGKIEN